MSGELVRAEPLPITVPWSGEMIDGHDAQAVVKALNEWKQLKERVSDFESLAEHLILEAMDDRGQYTMRYGTLEVRGDTPEDDYYYDVTEMPKLRDAGLPQDRYDQLVKTKVEERVDRRVAKTIAKNPKYAAIFEAARRVKPKKRRVWFPS